MAAPAFVPVPVRAISKYQAPVTWRGLFFGGNLKMWKIVLGFIVFAGLAIFLLNKGGDIDISGEKHGSVRTSDSYSA
ncbi:MAG: hypothetical protein HYX42_15040 [Polaromonas sp.]|uniref:hypothetical protein n=1 Tax=Polaromonas sp. TaxID=1869339 RepID=UPI0025CE91DC|nr:hypothetical protein [Polaromonas sp.]MBI2727554.1 hypothetical protein [Polaromonas sp.]